VVSFLGRRLALNSSKFLFKALGRKSLLIALASIVFLLIIFSNFGAINRADAASSQKEVEDETMHSLVQQMIKVGTTQYERTFYDQAEKTFSTALGYQEYLSAEERIQLSELLDRARFAALERNRALEHGQKAGELFREGKLVEAKTSLERIKDNKFLTEQERIYNTQLLEKINAQLGKTKSFPEMAGREGLDKVRTSVSTPPVYQEITVEPDSAPIRGAESRVSERGKQIAEVYYRSLRLYQSGRLEEAREGFVEVINSGRVPPAMVKTLQGYLKQIDNVLSSKALIVIPSDLVEKEPETTPATPRNEYNVGNEVNRPVIGLESMQPNFIEQEPARRISAEPVTRTGGYIEEIKNRRNIRRSHARAVVNDSIIDAQNSINNGEFDKAEETVERARRVVKEYEMDLGDELFKLYSDALQQLSQKITEARQSEIQQLEEKKRAEAIKAQRQFTEQMETDRQTRINTLLENAKAYTKQQNYEAALGQLGTLLAIDPMNDEALVLKDALEDMVYLRKQIEVQKESDKQRADVLLKTEESGIPFAEELTYPKNWREIIQKPTRQPDKTIIGVDPADILVYEQLDRVVDLSQLAPSMTFGEVINILKNSVEPPLQIQPNYRDLLENADIEPTIEANMDPLPRVQLRRALEILLDQVSGGLVELNYTVKDGIIQIATIQTLPPEMETRVYDITDLISQPANYDIYQQYNILSQQLSMMQYMMSSAGSYGGGGGTTGGYGGGTTGGFGGTTGGIGGGFGGGISGGGIGGGIGGGGYGGGGYGGGGYGGGGGYDTSMNRAQDLQYLIQDTIEPYSWYDYGGEGTITLYPSGLGGGYGGGGYGGTTGGYGGGGYGGGGYGGGGYGGGAGGYGGGGERPRKLVVLQTREIHTRIEKLLMELRKSLGNQVSIEARFLVVSENFLEDIGLDIDFSYNLGGKWGIISVQQGSEAAARAAKTKVPGSLGALAPAATAVGGYGNLLDDLQVTFLLRMTQARSDAKTLTAPKSTVLSGESASFSVSSQVSYAMPPDIVRSVSRGYYEGGGTEELGIQQNVFFQPIFTSLNITPVITQDKKNVLLNITTMMQDFLQFADHKVAAIVQDAEGNSEIVEYPVTVPEMETSQVMTRVSVPDGGTLLLGGQKISAEIEKEVGVPILSKIPVLGILFGSRSKVRDNKVLLILVKPTIILQEERETEAIAAMERGF
jgi:tetratricopeptide (TPR) repeat protein